MQSFHVRGHVKQSGGQLAPKEVHGGRLSKQVVRFGKRMSVKTHYAAAFPGSVESHMNMDLAWNALMLLMAGVTAYYITRGRKEEVRAKRVQAHSENALKCGSL
jgi:hypothetical protein